MSDFLLQGQKMIHFFKNIFKSEKEKEASTTIEYEAEKLLCGIENSEIQEHKIRITNYPFEPSFAYSEKKIEANDIESICVDFSVCKLHTETEEDVIFASAEKKRWVKRVCGKAQYKTS